MKMNTDKKSNQKFLTIFRITSNSNIVGKSSPAEMMFGCKSQSIFNGLLPKIKKKRKERKLLQKEQRKI